MNRPPIRTLPDAADAIAHMWLVLFEGDTIARFRTIVPTLVRYVGNGETFVRRGNTVIGVQMGGVNREPMDDVVIKSTYSLAPASFYVIAAGVTVTIETDAELRIL